MGRLDVCRGGAVWLGAAPPQLAQPFVAALSDTLAAARAAGRHRGYSTGEGGDQLLRFGPMDGELPMPAELAALAQRLCESGALNARAAPDSAIVRILPPGVGVPAKKLGDDYVRPFAIVPLVSPMRVALASDLRKSLSGEKPPPADIVVSAGSALVLQGPAADIAQHCVMPASGQQVIVILRRLVSYARRRRLQEAQEAAEKGGAAAPSAPAPAPTQQAGAGDDLMPWMMPVNTRSPAASGAEIQPPSPPTPSYWPGQRPAPYQPSGRAAYSPLGVSAKAPSDLPAPPPPTQAPQLPQPSSAPQQLPRPAPPIPQASGPQDSDWPYFLSTGPAVRTEQVEEPNALHPQASAPRPSAQDTVRDGPFVNTTHLMAPIMPMMPSSQAPQMVNGVPMQQIQQQQQQLQQLQGPPQQYMRPHQGQPQMQPHQGLPLPPGPPPQFQPLAPNGVQPGVTDQQLAMRQMPMQQMSMQTGHLGQQPQDHAGFGGTGIAGAVPPGQHVGMGQTGAPTPVPFVSIHADSVPPQGQRPTGLTVLAEAAPRSPAGFVVHKGFGVGAPSAPGAEEVAKEPSDLVDDVDAADEGTDTAADAARSKRSGRRGGGKAKKRPEDAAARATQDSSKGGKGVAGRPPPIEGDWEESKPRRNKRGGRKGGGPPDG